MQQMHSMMQQQHGGYQGMQQQQYYVYPSVQYMPRPQHMSYPQVQFEYTSSGYANSPVMPMLVSPQQQAQYSTSGVHPIYSQTPQQYQQHYHEGFERKSSPRSGRQQQQQH